LSSDNLPPDDFDPAVGRIVISPIEDQLREAYLTYAMSVIVSRALPDVRDGLKPSQRRILVAMHDLNLRPGSPRVKCAKISGDTSGNYHPHGEAVIYPTLVRMAQEWNMRHVLVDKQGNFGSIAGLPAAAMRYTEARLAAPAAMMLEDLDKDTVDFISTYDGRNQEPTVLPAKFPNLLVNGAGGIAVGMATSIPPHNLREVCAALVHLIDHPDATFEDIWPLVPGPDFPTGGTICGRSGIRRGYLTGRGNLVIRARATIEEGKGNRSSIRVTEIPYQQTRDRVIEKIAELIRDDRIKGISDLRDESNLEEPVRLILELKKDANPEVVLNQLYQFSPLQETFSVILLALVDGKPRTLTLLEMLREFLRHRITVLRRRTQFLLAKARRRKHTVEGLLLALANLDEIIRIIRSSVSRAEAKERLQGVASPASLLHRALGDDGFALFQQERGVADEYRLTPVQADAILAMTLGQLVNLEQEKLGNEFQELMTEIQEYLRLLADEKLLYDLIRNELLEISAKVGDDRRTEISPLELGDVDIGDLINEEMMVVTITHRGYIKRTAASVYRAQRRGGKGLIGAKVDEEDPIEQMFAASTHDYLLFFTNLGKVYWQKVYDLPEGNRDGKGRNIVNVLQLAENERVAACLAVRDFSEPDRYLLMATRRGLVKKTPLEAYGRPLKGGLIAIKLREEDELVDVLITTPGDEVVVSTAQGMAIRFNEADARPMGRNTSGVKGISLGKSDRLVSMVVADPEATLLTVCENGYGKRTPFGSSTAAELPAAELSAEDPNGDGLAENTSVEPEPSEEPETAETAESDSDGDTSSSNRRYRTQRRGGKGVRDIKTTARNGQVIGAVAVHEDDELLLMTAGGKIQRIACKEITVVGRNTQGVRLMSVESGGTLAAVVRVPRDEAAELPAEVEPS